MRHFVALRVFAIVVLNRGVTTNLMLGQRVVF
jgi:hypothetical protein